MNTFRDFARTCAELEAEKSRKGKISILARYLGGLEPEEAAIAALMMVGRTTPERGRTR